MHHRACDLRRRLPVVTSSDSQLCTRISATPGLSPVRLLTPGVSLMCKRSVPNSISLASHCYHSVSQMCKRSVQIHVSCDSCLSYVQRSVQKFHVSCLSCFSKLICNVMSLRGSQFQMTVQQLEQLAVSQLVLLSATHWPCLCY